MTISYKYNEFATHQPILIEMLKHTTGNVLECGCGDGSTQLIRDQIQNTDRRFVSLESNLEWLNKYTHLADTNHELYHVDATNDDTLDNVSKWINRIEELALNDFEMVFIDSSPWLSRKVILEYYKQKAKIILIHDFDYFPENNVIGTVTDRVKTSYNGNNQEIIRCNLDGIVKNYQLFYPPKEYFFGRTGPPTLVCSDIMDKAEFQSLMTNLESHLSLYYN